MSHFYKDIITVDFSITKNTDLTEMFNIDARPTIVQRDNPFKDTFDGSALDFDVLTEDVRINLTDEPCKDKKAVCKLGELNGSGIDDWWIVGRDYPVKSHRQYYDAIEDQIIKNIDPSHLKGAEVKTKSARNGRWGLRDYSFPNVQVPIKTKEGHETTVTLRIVAWSGLDGLTANNYMLGAIDNYCLNGMVFTKAGVNAEGAFTKVYKRNTKNFNLDRFAVHLQDSVEIFYDQAENYRKMALVPLNRTHGQQFIDDLKMSESKRDGLKAIYSQEILDRGSNVFALHSAFTNYSSHTNENLFRTRKTNNDVQALTMFKREEEVADIFTSSKWNELIAA
tara:strand:- start:1035 stop:2045 length:1011 start_codon:yes stop_codon:yes gene_type:complete